MRFGAKEGGVGIAKPNFHTLSNVLLDRPGPSKPSVFAYGEAISLRHKGGAFLFKLTANKVETFLRLVGSLVGSMFKIQSPRLNDFFVRSSLPGGRRAESRPF